MSALLAPAPENTPPADAGACARLLAGEGLVVQTPYAGVVVRRFSPDFVDELIMAAAVAGDVDSASERMREHIRRGRTEYRTAVETQAGDSLVPAKP